MSDLGNRQVMAKNILHYMEANGKSRQDMCEALGVKYTTFTDWVKGNSYPRIDKIELMANFFGVSKSDLIEQHDHRSNLPQGREQAEENFNSIFSRRLRYYLNKEDITQVELAKKLGVGNTSVYNWCSGLKTPRMDKVDKMCELFGCRRSDLMESKYTCSEPETDPFFNEITATFEKLTVPNKKKVLNYANGVYSLQQEEGTVLNAAHARPDSTAEQRKHDDDIMMDDDEWK